MTNAESNVYFVQQSGYMPLSKSAATSKEMVDFMTKNPNFKVAVDQLQYVRPQASVMALPKGTEIFRQAVEKLTVGLSRSCDGHERDQGRAGKRV